MSLQPLIPWLIGSLVISVVAMVAGVSYGEPLLAVAAAALFSAMVLVAGYLVNRPVWSLDPAQAQDDDASNAARRNARLMTIAFAWGAVAMFAVYTLSELRWYHAWQYGLAMALLGVFTFGYGLMIGGMRNTERRAMLLRSGGMLTLVQGIAAVGGLLFLLQSGKLLLMRSDWPANLIFLFGGIAIAGLSAIAVITQRKLMRA